MFGKQFPAILAIVLLVLMAVGCGGGNGDNADLRQINDNESPFSLVVEQIAGSVAESANTAIRHEVKTLKNDVIKVTLIADNAVEVTGAAVVLEYDATAVSPTRVVSGEFFGPDPLFFNTTDFAGEVPVAISQLKPFQPVNGSGVLAELYFEKGAFTRSVSDTGGQPPAASVSDLTAAYNPGTNQVSLSWTEVNPGDYNQDSRVSGPDVLYLAAHIGELAIPGTPAYCVDSDGSGFADTQDLFAIAANYRNEIDGYNVQTSENYTMLGPWTNIDYVERPALTGSDPNWASCLPIYGVDTDPLVYTPAFLPFWYRVNAHYQDDLTMQDYTGPNSNFATSQNAIVMQVGDLVMDQISYMDYNNDFGNGDKIWVEITAGEMEDTTAMSLNINFNNEYLDLDPESIILGDFFGSPTYTLFAPPEGVNDFDLVVWDDSLTAASGTGVVAYLAFDIDVDDEESNIYFGIDPEQGTLFTNATGQDTQFSATGDDWASWGSGMQPLHPPKPCYLFNDNFTSEYGTSGWEIGATGSDLDEDTGWYLDYTTFCSSDASLHWYDPSTEPEDSYGDRNDDWIMTPALDLSGYDPEDPEEMQIGISGYAMWELESGFPDPDYVNIEVATYPGYTDWTPIHSFTGVNVPDPDDPEDPMDDPACPGWTTLSIPLNDYYGERVKIRLKAHSDFSNPEPMFGFAVENFGVGPLNMSGGGGPVQPHAEILLVASDTSFISMWQTALEDMGFTSGTGEDTYTVTSLSAVSSASFLDPYDVVLVAGGTDLPFFDKASIFTQYLDAGGDNGANVFVMGDDLLFDLYIFGFGVNLAQNYIGMDGWDDNGALGSSSTSGVSSTIFDGASYSWSSVGSWPSSFGTATGGSTPNMTANNASPSFVGAQNSGTDWKTVAICNALGNFTDSDDRLDMFERVINTYFGFALPGGVPEGWPDVCPSADVLPVPAAGDGFGWGGGSGGPVGGGGGGNAASILLIDGSGTSTTDIPDWIFTLDDLGYAEGTGSNTWTEISSSSISSGSDLYDYDLVIWAGSTNYSSGAHFEDCVSFLQDYLDNGGGSNGANLFVMEDDIVFDIRTSHTSFLNNYLGIDGSTYDDDGAEFATQCFGQSGTAFDSRTFGWGFTSSLFPDTFVNASSAGTVNLLCDPSQSVFANHGAEVEGSGFKSITICSMIRKVDPDDRSTLVSDAISWFGFSLP